MQFCLGFSKKVDSSTDKQTQDPVCQPAVSKSTLYGEIFSLTGVEDLTHDPIFSIGNL
jgi:hypothetical protein